MKSDHRRGRGALATASAAAIAVLLSSCASTTGNITERLPGGYLSDSDDVCFSQRKLLDSSGNTFETELVRNVVIGAVAGAVTAAVTDNNVAAGAAIGAAAGAAGTYLVDLARKHKGDGNLIAQESIDQVRADNRQIDQLLSAFDAVVDCRRAEAQAVRARLADNQIDRATAITQMSQIRGRYNEDVVHTRKIAENISKRSTQYASVYNRLALDNGASGLAVSPPPSTTAPPTTKRRRSSARVVKTPPVTKAPDEPAITVGDKRVVEQHRQVTTSNVQKRDQVYEKVADANAQEDELFDLS